MELVIKGDNVFVMKSILCTRPNRSRHGYIYEDVRCLTVGLRGLSVSCVRRSANSAAHSLGRFGCHLDEDSVWLEESPPLAFEALYLDSNFINESIFKKKKKKKKSPLSICFLVKYDIILYCKTNLISHLSKLGRR